jgi:hypothetical protein
MLSKWKVLAAGLAGISTACLMARGSTPAGWVEARSAHFIVLSNANQKDAVGLASHFERMRAVFATLLPADDDDSARPIQVVAVRDQKDMQAMEPTAYLTQGGVNLSGFFLHSVDKDYILVRVDADEEHAYSVVYHEYTHSMLRRASGWMPLWLNEGLAQFYENTDFDYKAASGAVEFAEAERAAAAEDAADGGCGLALLSQRGGGVAVLCGVVGVDAFLDGERPAAGDS